MWRSAAEPGWCGVVLLGSDEQCDRGVAARPALAGRVLTASGPGDQLFGEIQAAFASYLRAERELGRLPAAVDADTVAFTLIGAVHHLFFTASCSEPDPGRVLGIVTALLGDAHGRA
jgi:hypothetical protein